MSDTRHDGGGHEHGPVAHAWEVLVARAREGRTISYGEMANTLLLSPQSSEFTESLNELSRTEEAAGRGLLSVLVIRQRQGTPGAGFFDLARELGRQFTNEKVFYLEESERVIAQWQGRRAEELDVLHNHVVEGLERLYFDSGAEETTETDGGPDATDANALSEEDHSLRVPLRRIRKGFSEIAIGVVEGGRTASLRVTRRLKRFRKTRRNRADQ